MKSLSILILIMATLLTLAGAPAMAAGSNEEILKHGEELFRQRADLEKAKEAAEAFSLALGRDPASERAAAQLAWASYWIGNHEHDPQAKLAAYQRGIDAAKQALTHHPNSLAGHFLLGVNYTGYGSTKGILNSLALVNPIMESMEAVIKRDPSFDGGGAYRVLGRVYYKLPGLFGGSNAKSIEYLRLAIKYGPRRWQSHIFLAETLLDEGAKDQARSLLEQVMAGPAEPGWEAEYAEERAWAQRLLEKIL